MSYRAAALCLIAAVGAPAMAQESAMDAEVQALRTYCRPDIERLCANVEPGEGRLKECLLRHKEQMSVGCAQALQKLKEKK